MKNHRLIALLLTIAVLACTISGCSGSNGVTEPSSVPSESTAVSEQPTASMEAQPAPVNEPPPASETPDIASDERIGSISTTNTGDTNLSYSEMGGGIDVISYPIDGSIQLSFWQSFPSMIFGDIINGWDDMPALPIIEEKTGVDITFVSPSEASQTEQFNLMMVSGEYTDILSLRSYTGGIQVAFEEEICIDLTGLVPEYAPNYYALLEYLDDYTLRQVYTEEGQMLQICTLASEVLHEQGLAVRLDWLEKWGMEVPTTIDETYEYLTAAYNEYNCKYPIFIDGSSVLDGFTSAFGVPGMSLEFGGAALMLDGEKIVSSLTADGYRAYIETFAQWYDEGLINSEFYSEQYGPDYINAYVSADDCALTTMRGDKFETMKNSAVDPNFAIRGISALTLEKGDTYKFQPKSSRKGNGEISVSTKCEHPEEAVMFLNWFYTDEGYILSNYGEENVCFVYSENGEPEYTDFVFNNPNGWNMMSVRNIFTNPIFTKYQNATALLYTYPDYELEAFEEWAKGTDECSLPSLTLTADESSEYALIITDLTAYASEAVLKWMVGEEELTENAWNAYVAQLEGLKLGRVVEIYQAAYDRFMGH